MRKRFFIFISLFVFVALAVIFWLRPAKLPAQKGDLSNTSQQVQSPLVNANSPKGGVPNLTPSTASPSTNVTTIDFPSHERLKTPEGFKESVDEKNVPIEFYGKLIDQNSNALVGVDISVTVRHWTMPLPFQIGSQDISMERTSDNDGRFELSGSSGDCIDIKSIFKEGYELEPGKRTFDAVGGSLENPVIFKMWSTNIHETLISGRKSFRIEPDGRPYFVNLTDGTIAQSGPGDLKVWVKRPGQITSGQRYDWSCEVDAINGGLLEQPLGSAMYAAPSDGYISSFGFDQTVGSGWGDSTGERQFYVTFNNGQEYGRVNIELFAYYNNQTPGLMRLSYTINPSGSRVLR